MATTGTMPRKKTYIATMNEFESATEDTRRKG
jgi:hypothetical protein